MPVIDDPRPNWDEWAMGIAFAVSRRADCRRKAVGAVILDGSRKLISVGWNGVGHGRIGCLAGGCPRGMLTYEECPEGSDYDNPDQSFCVATHAELNALIRADYSKLSEATMYVTIGPCSWCMKVIKNAGLYRLVYCATHLSAEEYMEIQEPVLMSKLV
jgi:dCMP deaminase